MAIVDAQDGQVSPGLPAVVGSSEPFSAPLLTYQDAYEHLLDVHHQNGKDVSTQGRRIRRAVMEAHRLLPSLHDWEYFHRVGNLVTDVPVTLTGVYVASTLAITLSAGTWPVNATYGTVLINAVRYPVRRRVSDTVIELEHGPAADVTIAVRWQRYRYLLPADVGDITELIDPKQFHTLRRVTSAQAFWHTQSTNVDANPFAWALISSRDFPGRWEIWLSGSGTTVRELNYMYNVRHDNLSVQELSTGTVNVTGDIATFSNTILTDRCVGSVLRVATDTLVPTSEYGRIERDLLNGTEEDVVRPGEYERIITAVTSTTTALLSSVGTTVANRGFTISSHIDVNYEGMRELFLRLAEEQYDIVTRAENVIQKRSRAIRIEAMRTAMAADGPGPTRPHSGFYRGDVILDENN